MGQRDNTALPLTTAGAATGQAVTWPGGDGVFNCVGTWGGATATLQYLGADGTTWVAAGAYTTLTADGGGVFSLPVCSIRVAITNAGTTSLTATAERYDTA